MKTWTAPVIVATIGITVGFLVEEPAVGILTIGLALCGYAINQADNR